MPTLKPQPLAGTPLNFAADSGFYAECRRRVQTFFDEHGISPHATLGMYLKTAAILGWFAASYVLLVFVAANWWQGVLLSLSMALALPFAYLQVRSGGVGLKVFSGIMIGILFHMLNNLSSHLGLLQSWRPFFAAAAPSVVFLVAATAMMWWVERR